MKVYKLLDEFESKVPSFELDLRAYQAAQDQFVKELAEQVRKIGWTGDLTGEVWHHPIADGYAQYMVIEAPAPRKAMGLMHLPLGDAWQAPEYVTRGVRRADIVAAAKRNRSFS